MKQEQAMALLQLLAHGRKEIEEGRITLAADVFAQIEALDNPATHFLEVVAVKNRVIYEVIEDKIYIHIICGARQDVQTKLSRRPVRILRP